jgi:demethylmenaquinone methyltransferase / 2-methoxy-6-polyprenyl-1,4-benzoquinol methylase
LKNAELQITTSKERRKNLPKKYVQIQREINSEDRKAKFVMYLFSEGPREYDFLLKILSLGRDRFWRSSIVRKVGPLNGGKVLDIACGTGLVSFEFGSLGSYVVGIDVTREMLVRALALAKKDYGYQEVNFIQARAENLPLKTGSFDCATISLATRNVSDATMTFEEMRRCVKDGGSVISMDFTRPTGKIFRPFYNFYIFYALPALGLTISRHWRGIFSYLANSIERSRSPEEISKIMQNVGLSRTEIKRMTKGVTAVVSGTKMSLQSTGLSAKRLES